MISRMRTVRRFAQLSLRYVKIIAPASKKGKGKKYRCEKMKMIICGIAFDIMGCRSLYEQD